MTENELFAFKIKAPDAVVYAEAKKKWDAIAKPIDGLGRLEELICRIAAMQQRIIPDIKQKTLLIFCADNGVTAEGISQTTPQVTADVAGLMGQNKSSVGILTRGYPLKILPVDIGMNTEDTPPGVRNVKVRRGTGNIAREPAMTEKECLRAIEAGIGLAKEAVCGGSGLLATGEMGIGNTTTSAALLCALTGLPAEAVTGKGAGLSDEGLAHKIRIVEKALSLHAAGLRRSGSPAAFSSGDTSGVQDKDGSDIMSEEYRTACLRALARLGGLDIAGLAGVYIGGAISGVPVVIDGFISAVAALAAEMLLPGCRAYMIASHRGRERGTMEALRRLDLTPVIEADLALGEGTGAVLLLPMLDMALSLYSSGTAFSETDIGAYTRFSS